MTGLVPDVLEELSDLLLVLAGLLEVLGGLGEELRRGLHEVAEQVQPAGGLEPSPNDDEQGEKALGPRTRQLGEVFGTHWSLPPGSLPR